MKKIITLALALLVVLSFAGCTKKPAKAVTIKVWASAEDQDLTRELADKFIAAQKGKDITIELGVVGEPDAYKTFSEDPQAAADVFFFPHDQIRDFVNAGGLYEITKNKADIVARNGEGSVSAATVNGKLYAYPATADNGYFMYYDKSVFTAEDVKTLDKMLEVANAAGKKVFFNLDNNGWYVASFFLGNGGSLAIVNGKQTADFNNANGLAAAKAMQAFCANPAYINGDDNVLKGGIGGTIAAGVSGTWNAKAIEEVLGANYAATKLPTATMDGKQVQLGSFSGYKFVGVNATITDGDKLAVALDFADFLTNEESQLLRFEKRAFGPSNVKALANPAVKSVALDALTEQNAFATPQDVLGTYWGPAGAFGTAMVNKDTTDLQTLLDNMVKQIQE